MTQEVLRALDRLPLGAFTGTAHGRRYLVSRMLYCGGASEKLVARELGGSDRISLNLYRLTPPRLIPCEMSVAKVTRFVTGLRPDGGPAREIGQRA